MPDFASLIMREAAKKLLSIARNIKPEQLFALADKLGAMDPDENGLEDDAAKACRWLGKRLSLVVKGLELLAEVFGVEK